MMTQVPLDLLERLIEGNPSFHAWGDGSPADWSVDPQTLRFKARRLSAGMNTVETGGSSTLLFALAGTCHGRVTPDQEAGGAPRHRRRGGILLAPARDPDHQRLSGLEHQQAAMR